MNPVVRTVRDLAALVRDERTGQGLTQAALAERARVSREWLVAFESGTSNAQLVKVFRVLEALDLNVSVGSEQPRPTHQPGAEPVAAAESTDPESAFAQTLVQVATRDTVPGPSLAEQQLWQELRGLVQRRASTDQLDEDAEG